MVVPVEHWLIQMQHYLLPLVHLTNSLALTTESFGGSFTLTDNVKYHVVLFQVGANVDGTNYYQVGGI